MSPEGSVITAPGVSNLGGNHTFACLALGGPGNTYLWTRLRNGNILGNMSSLTVIVEGEDDDGGEYLCVVTNLAGSDFAVVTLNGEDC